MTGTASIISHSLGHTASLITHRCAVSHESSRLFVVSLGHAWCAIISLPPRKISPISKENSNVISHLLRLQSATLTKIKNEDDIIFIYARAYS